jgi:hypothetical protein
VRHAGAHDSNMGSIPPSPTTLAPNGGSFGGHAGIVSAGVWDASRSSTGIRGTSHGHSAVKNPRCHNHLAKLAPYFLTTSMNSSV